MFSRASGGRSRVKLDVVGDAGGLGFRREARTVVDAGKLEALGWRPAFGLEDTVGKLVREFTRNHRLAQGGC